MTTTATSTRMNPMLPPACRAVREQLPAYTEDRLEADALALVRTHLDGCPGCRGERAALEQADALLAAAFADNPWDDAGVEALVASLPARASTASTANASASARSRAVRDARPRRMGGGVGVAVAAVAIAALALALRDPGGARSTTDVAKGGPGTQAPAAVVAHAGTGMHRLGASAQALRPGDPIHAGDHLVAIATPAEVDLTDGSRVRLHADTEITLRDDADGGLTVALTGAEGQVYCEVRPRQHPLRVAARGLDVTVLGTRFLVNQTLHVARVVVVEGSVMAQSAGDERVLVRDEGAEVRDGEMSLRGVRVDASNWSEVGSWLPRVRDELRARLAAPSEPVGPPPSGPAGAAPEPPLVPPSQPEIDVPILPPPGPDGPAPVGPR